MNYKQIRINTPTKIKNIYNTSHWTKFAVAEKLCFNRRAHFHDTRPWKRKSHLELVVHVHCNRKQETNTMHLLHVIRIDVHLLPFTFTDMTRPSTTPSFVTWPLLTNHITIHTCFHMKYVCKQGCLVNLEVSLHPLFGCRFQFAGWRSIVISWW